MKFIDSIYDKKDDTTNLTKDILYRILGSLLSSFLFLNLLPTYMFIIYMKEKGIFSYDLFSNGVFGISVFFFYGIMLIILLAIFMTSSLYFLIGYFVKKKCNCENSKKPRYCKYDYKEEEKLSEDGIYQKSEFPEKEYRDLFIVSIIINAFLIYGMTTINQSIVHLIFLLIICVILTLHFAIFIFLKAKFTIYSLLILFPFSILILFTYSPQTADIISFGLHSFNSSNKIVDVKDMNNNILLSGKMLLLSPENIYVYTQENNETNSTQIIKRDNIIINIKN